MFSVLYYRCLCLDIIDYTTIYFFSQNKHSNYEIYSVWPWLEKKWIFNFIYYMTNHIYGLKAVKKLYKGHLNGTYRFLTRNSDNCGSKLLKTHVLFTIPLLHKLSDPWPGGWCIFMAQTWESTQVLMWWYQLKISISLISTNVQIISTNVQIGGTHLFPFHFDEVP